MLYLFLYRTGWELLEILPPGNDHRRGGTAYGDHHQPDQSAVYPPPEAGGLRFLSPQLRGVPLRQPQAAGGGIALGGGPPHRGVHGSVCPAGAAGGGALRPGAAGPDEVDLPGPDATGRPRRLRPAGPGPSGDAGGPPVRGAGRGPGPGERGDDPADGGRLPR